MPHTNDPQITVTGTIKQCRNNTEGEIITFTIPLQWFELVCIVNVPAEGETHAPVYVKFKVARRRSPGPHGEGDPRPETRSDEKSDDKDDKEENA